MNEKMFFDFDNKKSFVVNEYSELQDKIDSINNLKISNKLKSDLIKIEVEEITLLKEINNIKLNKEYEITKNYKKYLMK